MIEIGSKIRMLRKSKAMTITQLAGVTGLSTSLLSQIETGKTSPSIATLRKIAMALETSLVQFFEGDQSTDIVVRRGQRKYLGHEGSQVRYQLLSPDLNRAMEPVLLELEPGESEFEGPALTHRGEECMYVVEGRLKFELGGVLYVLDAGDSVYFDASMGHRIANGSDKKTVVIGVVTPPSF